jgi:hypothetical protein
MSLIRQICRIKFSFYLECLIGTNFMQIFLKPPIEKLEDREPKADWINTILCQYILTVLMYLIKDYILRINAYKEKF